jgi:hypothetical protein
VEDSRNGTFIRTSIMGKMRETSKFFVRMLDKGGGKMRMYMKLILASGKKDNRIRGRECRL